MVEWSFDSRIVPVYYIEIDRDVIHGLPSGESTPNNCTVRVRSGDSQFWWQRKLRVRYQHQRLQQRAKTEQTPLTGWQEWRWRL